MNIEERIERSIQLTFDTAGVTESEIPSRKQLSRENRWSTAEEQLKLLGPAAYSAYRMGSGAIHGSWHDLERNHLELVDGKFLPDPDPAPERPQVLFAMALAGITVAADYIEQCSAEARNVFNPRFDSLLQRLGHANDLHEEFLIRQFDRHADGLAG